MGTGFEHKRLPKALVDEASKRGIPLFEVPYEMPFIAITERAFATLVNEQYAVLERGAQVHERLERLVLEGRGLEAILGSIASAVGGSAIVLDATGESSPATRQGRPRRRGAEGARRRGRRAAGDVGPDPVRAPAPARWPDAPWRVPVPGRRGGAPMAWLIVVSQRRALG